MRKPVDNVWKKGLLSSLNLLLYYVCISVLLSAVLGALYMIYTLCGNLVAGQTLAFDAALFAGGVLYFAPLVLVFGALLMIFLLIRHPVSSILPLIMYCLIYVCSWLVVIPQLVRGDAAFHAKADVQAVAKPSAGYFRRMGDAVFYYASVGSDDNLVSGLAFDTAAATDNVYAFRSLELFPRADTFTDSLIQDTLEMPPALSLLVSRSTMLLGILQRCATGSLGRWLCFASLGLALLGVWGLRRLSVWRLVNVLFAIVVTAGIIVFNMAGYTNSSFVAFESSLIKPLLGVGFVKKLSMIGNPLVIAGNVVAFVILVVLGLACAGRRRPALEDMEEEPV